LQQWRKIFQVIYPQTDWWVGGLLMGMPMMKVEMGIMEL
jgi:hypothetical protein